MYLKLDQAIRIQGGAFRGTYRVVGFSLEEYFLAVIESESDTIPKRGPKTSALAPSQPKIKSCFYILRLPIKIIHQLMDEYILEKVEFKLSNRALKSVRNPNVHKASSKISVYDKYQENIVIMRDFLDPSTLLERVIKDKSFSGLITKTERRTNVGNRKIYRLLERLIIYGFYENSLIPHYYLSGGPGRERTYGQQKPSKLGLFKKSGAKSLAYHHASLNGLELPLELPGMSEEWKKKCAISISKIPKPHPSLSKMYISVMADQFSTKLEITNKRITPLALEKGTGPTFDQFKYFVKNHFSLLEHTKRVTTNFNFNQNHRGLMGTSYEGVCGPGHTFAIDSTLADIYLISSLNHTVIIGRPVLYMIVDVWSGAILGFFICLSGPSWNMAKVALFNAVYDPERIAELTGVPYMPVFKHKPGLCAVLLGDRGEYISHKASMTCLILEIDQEFTAPYRGDGKGIVEVQFRIGKDEQINFVPGTHDARRKEMQQRQSKPDDATFTIHRYMIHVSSQIRKYNLTADMSHRLTDFMKAAGVHATPAGLWDWGHEVGISADRKIDDDYLIRTMLPKMDARSTANGINANGRIYADLDNPIDKQMAAIARNYGESEIDAWIYPGNIQSIWTDEGSESGLRNVERSDGDSSYVTEEEYQDAAYTARLSRLENAHAATEIGVQEHLIQKANIDESIRLKKFDKHQQPLNKQNLTNNREAENARYMHQDQINTFTHEISDESTQGIADQFNDWLASSLKGDADE